jgi:N-acetylglucosaminyl-diphospho-decaprenol L-rhamnosyltransferase
VDIAVGIINWNSGHWLKDCVASLLATSDATEIVVVDNASTDRSLDEAAGFGDRVKFVRNESNLGFAGGVNQTFASTSAPFVLILNPDVGVTTGVVGRMQRFLDAHPKAGAIGGHVGENYFPRRLPTTGSLIRENLGLRKRSLEQTAQEPYEIEQAAAAALMIRRSAFLEVGGFDNRFYPAWYEDVDFCKRLKSAGWRIYFDPVARFLHEGGYSAKALGTSGFAAAYYRNQLRYVHKHMSRTSGMAIRCSMVAGMVARTIAAPASAGAYWSVLAGAMGKW